MASQTATVDTLNSLLRGEISAVETYQQAEQKFSGDTEMRVLKQIRQEHEEAVTQLRQHVHSKGGTDSETSGAWGTFAQLVEGGAKLFGKTAALKALKEGEEHGINSFKSALNDSSLSQDCHSLIQQMLLPRCQQHIQTLDQLMAKQ